MFEAKILSLAVHFTIRRRLYIVSYNLLIEYAIMLILTLGFVCYQPIYNNQFYD